MICSFRTGERVPNLQERKKIPYFQIESKEHGKMFQKLRSMISVFIFVMKQNLKRQGHISVNKPVISRVYIVAHTWPLCSEQIFVDGVNPH